jgi:uncharacterized damage-inducible protein DinB
MFTAIEQFESEWKLESDNTKKILSVLTDPSLTYSASPDHRTVGRMAWHIIQTLPEMANRTGLLVNGPSETDPLPETSIVIKKAYEKAAESLLREVSLKWTDESLQMEDDLYGMKWKKGASLYILIKHEIHHRAQMEVLMRMAGLKVPGIYGPSKEEWSQQGIPEPAI